MQNVNRKMLALVVTFAAAPLAADGGGPAAPDAQQAKPAEQAPAERGQTAEQSPAPARRTLPRVTGTVLRWTGNRIDLKTPDGKTQKVAVNRDTERLVKIAPGAEVTVEYRRQVSGFLIAHRLLPPGEPEAVRSATAPSTVTGSVVSWNDATLVVKTEAGDVTLFLSPETEYRVETLSAGLPVTVEYQGRDQGRLALRVRAAGEAASEEKAAEPGEGPGQRQPY